MKIKRKNIICCFVVVAFFQVIHAFAGAEYLSTAITKIQDNPSEFYGKDVEIKAYFYKENNIWVGSLAEPDKYIGVFVTKPEKENLAVHGEYFGFIFVPQDMQSQVHFLKPGDEITIRGKCFEFKSISIDGPGIMAAELLSGWGNKAKPAAAFVPITREEVISLMANKSTPVATESSAGTPLPSVREDKQKNKYTLYLNGKEYQGLNFGNEYIFEGTHFRVEK